MQNIIVADTSCLILLSKIGHLGLLKSFFGQVLITKDIADEFREDIPDYLYIENPKNKYYQTLLERMLDKIRYSNFRISKNLLEDAKKKAGE